MSDEKLWDESPTSRHLLEVSMSNGNVKANGQTISEQVAVILFSFHEVIFHRLGFVKNIYGVIHRDSQLRKHKQNSS